MRVPLWIQSVNNEIGNAHESVKNLYVSHATPSLSGQANKKEVHVESAAWPARLIAELDAAEKKLKNWRRGSVESLTGNQDQVRGVSGNVSNTCASSMNCICLRSRVRWRVNR